MEARTFHEHSTGSAGNLWSDCRPRRRWINQHCRIPLWRRSPRSGAGTVGGLFSANTVNSTTQYNIGGNRVFSTTGINNVFVGADTATTGSSNTFVGDNTGTANTTGTSNTLLGADANVGAGTLTFATAVGSGAVVNNNDSIVLGRAADTVRVPGNLTVTGTFTAATFTLPATNITGILAAANGGTHLDSDSNHSLLGPSWRATRLRNRATCRSRRSLRTDPCSGNRPKP